MSSKFDVRSPDDLHDDRRTTAQNTFRRIVGGAKCAAQSADIERVRVIVRESWMREKVGPQRESKREEKRFNLI